MKSDMPDNRLPPVSDRLAAAYDPARFRELGHRAVDLLADHLEAAVARESERVLPIDAPEAAHAYWEKRPATDTLPLLADFVERSNRLHDPRYMGHQVAVTMVDAAIAGLADEV
ncbi:MAG: hypothetical protein AAFN78_18575, partial [Pseudomonadota bacterium]